MKRLLKQLFVNLGGSKVFRLYNRTPRILFWHGVDSRVNPDVEKEIFDIDLFEEQVKYLVKYFEIISIEDFETRFKNKSFTNKEIVLTFDDGYANNLYIVEPILNKYNLPFTVFVSTEHITTGQFFPTSVNRIIFRGSGLNSVTIPSQNRTFYLETEKDVNNAINTISNLLKTLPLEQVREITNDLINNVSKDKWLELQETYKSVRPMNWDEVVELSKKKNVTIGSHCMWHICCHSNQPEKEIRKEIEISRKEIENHISKECKYFAYPNGDFTIYSNEIIKQFYSMGFSVNGKDRITKENDISIIPRICVYGNIDTFKILTNLYPKKQLLSVN